MNLSYHSGEIYQAILTLENVCHITRMFSPDHQTGQFLTLQGRLTVRLRLIDSELGFKLNDRFDRTERCDLSLF